MPTVVPNQQPLKPASRRLAIIGEAPGTSETTWHTCSACAHEFETEWWERGRRVVTDKCTRCYTRDIRHTPKPFVGKSGRLLNLLLAEVGIERDTCYLGNCAQVQPPRNEIALFKWDGPELVSGMEVLRSELAAWQPHMLLLLGNTPLRHLTGDRKRNIGDWRGSLINITLDGPVKPVPLAAGVLEAPHNPGSRAPSLDRPSLHTEPPRVTGERPKALASAPYGQSDSFKALATYHPAALLRETHLTGVTRFDMKRLAEELRIDGLVLPRRDVEIWHPDEGYSAMDVVAELMALKTSRAISFDIEGVVDYVECIGFSDAPEWAGVVPFISTAGESVWSEADEQLIWAAVRDLLEAPEVPKIAQNSLYDCFVLAWSYGIMVRPLADDTMLKHHELYCELEKSLAFQASIYTREPYYKFQRKHAKRLAEAAATAE